MKHALVSRRRHMAADNGINAVTRRRVCVLSSCLACVASGRVRIYQSSALGCSASWREPRRAMRARRCGIGGVRKICLRNASPPLQPHLHTTPARTLPQNATARYILHALLRLAHSLPLRKTAERQASEHQMAHLAWGVGVIKQS